MQQRTTRTVDADGHVTEPAEIFREYIEPKYRDRALHIERNERGWEFLVIDNHPSVLQPGILGVLGGIGMDAKQRLTPGMVDYRDSCPPAGYDGAERLKVMDDEGIDYALLYPTLGLVWERDTDDAELAAAHARAYNDWVADYCAADPL